MPVVDHGQVTGILTGENIVHSTSQGNDPTKTQVGEIMSVGEITCSEAQTLLEVAQIMDQMNKQQLIVLNKNKRPVRIVSWEDISKHSGIRSGGGTSR